MRFPMRLNYDLTKYIISNKMKKIDKYPLVPMLEPTHLCNLACPGCGRIREYADTLKDMMTLEDCLKSVDECPAPLLPLPRRAILYPEIHERSRGIAARQAHLLRTNALLLDKHVDLLPAHPNFILNIHMDGLEETPRPFLNRKGAFKIAIDAIAKAKQKGLRVRTNTTIFKETDLVEIEMLLRAWKRWAWTAAGRTRL